MQKTATWIDFIKVFGVLATLFLHSNATLVNFQTSVVSYPVELNMTYWSISAVFASLAGPSFALIFMYLGAVTLSSGRNDYAFFLNKAKRLLLPLVFWSLFALLFQRYVMHWPINIVQKLSSLLTQPVANNLAILYLLIVVFLSLPFVKYLYIKTTRKQHYVIASFWLVLCTLLLSLQRLYDIQFPFILFMGFAYLGFMQFGYLLATTKASKRLLQLGFLLFLVGNIWTIWGTLHYSTPELIAKGIYANYFFNRVSIPMILSSLGSFILLRYVAESLMQRERVKNAVHHISHVALGMCMVYPYWFIILGTEKIGIELTAFAGSPLWAVPLTALATIVGSYITMVLFKKIPYLHNVTPRLV